MLQIIHSCSQGQDETKKCRRENLTSSPQLNISATQVTKWIRGVIYIFHGGLITLAGISVKLHHPLPRQGTNLESPNQLLTLGRFLGSRIIFLIFGTKQRTHDLRRFDLMGILYFSLSTRARAESIIRRGCASRVASRYFTTPWVQPKTNHTVHGHHSPTSEVRLNAPIRPRQIMLENLMDSAFQYTRILLQKSTDNA